MENNKTEVLREYYSKYLTDIKGLKMSSVRHYNEALKNISHRLREKGLVEKDIFEIRDLNTLHDVREILYEDDDFAEMNRRGNHMYSAGLNNYCKFAEGEDYFINKHSIDKMDMPLDREDPVIVEQKVWRRSDILRMQVIAASDYKCEINKLHESFTAEATNKPYMEGHHAIPMRLQDHFERSLDIYANIVCLCPICHKKIHHGLKHDRRYMLQKIFDDRAERLEMLMIS